MQGTRSLFSRDITVGGSQFTDVLQRNLGLSFQEAEAVKRGAVEAVDGIEGKSIVPLMNDVTEIVALEIQKTFDFYGATTEDGEIVIDVYCGCLFAGGSYRLGCNEVPPGGPI